MHDVEEVEERVFEEIALVKACASEIWMRANPMEQRILLVENKMRADIIAKENQLMMIHSSGMDENTRECQEIRRAKFCDQNIDLPGVMGVVLQLAMMEAVVMAKRCCLITHTYGQKTIFKLRIWKIL
jgi:hypothetical protein